MGRGLGIDRRLQGFDVGRVHAPGYPIGDRLDLLGLIGSQRLASRDLGLQVRQRLAVLVAQVAYGIPEILIWISDVGKRLDPRILPECIRACCREVGAWQRCQRRRRVRD